MLWKINGYAPLTPIHQNWIHQILFGPIHTVTFNYQYNSWCRCTHHHSLIQHISLRLYTMDTTQYWPFAREYAIWNATVSALQFWMESHEPNILSDTIERVYMAFFCNESSQQLWNLSRDVLFSHFVTTLNDTFECELAQEDEGYESGSESLNIPTPLPRTPRLYPISTCDNLSFDPAAPLTQQNHIQHLKIITLYAAIWHSATPMRRALYKQGIHVLNTPDHYEAMYYPQEHHHPHHYSTRYLHMALKYPSRRRRFSHYIIRWWHLVRRPSSWEAPVYKWSITAKFAVSLSLTIWLGFSIFHPWRYAIPQDDGPRWHLRVPRYNDDHQWWRYSWPRRCF